MNQSTHGGARPKVREDDGRKNNQPVVHPGRKPKSFTLKLGDTFWKSRKDTEGNGALPSETWTVVEITRTHVVFSSNTGDTYRLVR